MFPVVWGNIINPIVRVLYTHSKDSVLFKVGMTVSNIRSLDSGTKKTLPEANIYFLPGSYLKRKRLPTIMFQVLSFKEGAVNHFGKL